MRLKFLLILVISGLVRTNFAASEKGLSIAYRVKESKKDTALKSTESVYSFTYNVVDSITSKSNVEYSIDGVPHFAKLDRQAHFDVKTTPGKHVFLIYIREGYDEIYTDSIAIEAQHRLEIELYYVHNRNRMICDKPVIYLYPVVQTLVKVEVVPKGEFTFTYPSYGNGWEVTAAPNGALTMGDATYNYLFWEAKVAQVATSNGKNEGYLVKGENTLAFLEEKLNAFGFTSQEKADFITYWGPILSKQKKNRIQFVMNDNCDDFATLTITPKPNHIYRFYILSSPVAEDADYLLEPQIISPMQRTGFTVLEWGGSVVSEFINLF